MAEEATPLRMVTKLTLVKYDGDPPSEGEVKEPVEIIEITDEGFPEDVAPRPPEKGV